MLNGFKRTSTKNIRVLPSCTSHMLRIASFDIGKKNFAQSVEECSQSKLESLRMKYLSLPKKMQRRVKGRMNSEIEKILKEMYLDSKRISTGVFDLRHDQESNTLDIPTRRNLINHLSKFEQLWATCDIFIIEQQYFNTYNPRGRKKSGTGANVDAIKIGEAVMTWFLDNFPFKQVMYFGSQYKTQMLGAQVGLNKTERKKWAVDKALEIYTLRKDEGVIELYRLAERVKRKRINTEEKVQEYLDTYPHMDQDDMNHMANYIVRRRQKLDDIADAMLQVQAFKYRTFVGCF